MTEMGTASISGAAMDTATDGQVGLLWRTSVSEYMLVNENGHHLEELIEKGVMGATFYFQITAVYLSDARIGNGVNNDSLVAGENYTDMEHHWDEAFGYLGVPADFSSDWPESRNDETIFIGKYIRGRDELMGSSSRIMNAFKTGRAAIVAKAYEARDAQRDIIYEELERVFAATAIHYINEALANQSDEGDFFHALTEAYGFVRAMQFNPRSQLSSSEILQLLKDLSDPNFNFWQTTLTGLNTAKASLADTYGLNEIKDDL
jgi:hypothetical protein